VVRSTSARALLATGPEASRQAGSGHWPASAGDDDEAAAAACSAPAAHGRCRLHHRTARLCKDCKRKRKTRRELGPIIRDSCHRSRCLPGFHFREPAWIETETAQRQPCSLGAMILASRHQGRTPGVFAQVRLARIPRHGIERKDENPECYCQNRKEKWQKRKMLDEQK